MRSKSHAAGGGEQMWPAVLLVGNFLSGAGLSRGVCEDLAIRLRGAGWTVTTVSAHPGRLRRLTDMLLSTWTLRREYSVCQVDVFSGPSFFWAGAVTWLLRLAGKPYVLTLHGGLLPLFASKWPAAVRAALGPASAVTAPSEYLRREMKPYRDRIVLLRNPLDLGAYPFLVRSNPRPKLAWLRAFHETYNPSLAPAVLAIVARQYSDASLTMVGPDKGDGSLQRTLSLASRLGVADRLRVIAGIPKAEVGGLLSESDIFLNTTNVDNSPVSVIEAMACGLCVVSTDVGGLPDMIVDGKDGILVPPSDPEAMAAAVLRILGGDALATHLSVNARSTSALSDWSVVLPEWQKILHAAVRDV